MMKGRLTEKRVLLRSDRLGRSTIRPAAYDKPLSLKLQWVLKEMKEKSSTMRRVTPGRAMETTREMIDRSFAELSVNPTLSPPSFNDSKINLIIQNLTDPLNAHEPEDYPNDNDFDYSDYAYEDSTDQTSTSIKTTTMTTARITTATIATTTTTTTPEDLSIDDTQTAYYDYGDHDVYSDDEVEETSTTTTKAAVRSTTTVQPLTTPMPDRKERIPYYHRRPPIIWNINIDENDDEQQAQVDNSGSSLTYSLLLQLLIGLARV